MRLEIALVFIVRQKARPGHRCFGGLALDISVRYKRWDVLNVGVIQLPQGDSFLQIIHGCCTTCEYAPAVLEIDELRVKRFFSLSTIEELTGNCDVATSAQAQNSGTLKRWFANEEPTVLVRQLIWDAKLPPRPSLIERGLPQGDDVVFLFARLRVLQASPHLLRERSGVSRDGVDILGTGVVTTVFRR